MSNDTNVPLSTPSKAISSSREILGLRNRRSLMMRCSSCKNMSCDLSSFNLAAASSSSDAPSLVATHSPFFSTSSPFSAPSPFSVLSPFSTPFLFPASSPLSVFSPVPAHSVSTFLLFSSWQAVVCVEDFSLAAELSWLTPCSWVPASSRPLSSAASSRPLSLAASSFLLFDASR